MIKLLNTKSIAVAIASVITVGIIGAFANDNHKTQAARKALKAKCPERRDQLIQVKDLYSGYIDMRLDTEELYQLKSRIEAEVRQCDKFGY